MRRIRPTPVINGRKISATERSYPFGLMNELLIQYDAQVGGDHFAPESFVTKLLKRWNLL